jgi:hypothetical protein
MSSSAATQFGNMLSSRWSLTTGKKAASSPPSKQKASATHETVTYPRINLTDGNDSCLIPSMSYEHVLACGHLIATPKPNERCAPNCNHVANGRSQMTADVQDKGKAKVLPFYCDACVETENETLIPTDITSTAAGEYPNNTARTDVDHFVETLRRDLRQIESAKRGKQTKFRKCYIALKITSVPCHADGVIRKGYAPRKEHHLFDTVIPQVGDNFFEDMLVNPTEEVPSSNATFATALEQTDEHVAASSPANLGEAGANYLRYTQAQSEAQKGSKARPVSNNTKNGPSQSGLREATASSLAAPSSHGVQQTFPQQSRKRTIANDDEDEEYEDAPEEETEVVQRPRKRQKVTSAPLAPAPAPRRKVGRPRGSGGKQVCGV